MFGILRGNKKKKSFRKSSSSVYEEDIPCFLPEDFNFKKNKKGKYVFNEEGFQEDMQDILDVLQCQGDYDDETVNTRRTKSNKSVTQSKDVDLLMESPTELVRSISNVIMGVESDDGESLETYDDYGTKKKKRFSKWGMFRKKKDTGSVFSQDAKEDGFGKIISDLSFGAINTARFMMKDSEDDYTEEDESIVSRQKYSKAMTRSSPSVKRSVASRASALNRPRLDTAPSRISSRAQSSIAKGSLGMRSAASVVSRKSYMSRATYKSRMSRKTAHSTKVNKSPIEKPVVEKNTTTSVNIVQGLNARKQYYVPSPFAKKEVAKPDEFVIAISDDGDKENDDISILTDDPKLTENSKKRLGKSSVPNLDSMSFGRSSDNHSTALSYKNPKHRMVQKNMQKARTRMEYDETYLESLPKDSFKDDQKRKNRSSAKSKYADETSVVVTTKSSQGRVVKNMVSLKSGLR